MFAATGRFSSLEIDERIKFYEFMNDLYRSTAYDGQDQDAAGFYSWGGDRRALGKSDGDARHLIRTCAAWHALKINPQLLYLCHARGAMSDATKSSNNHPFIGDNVALMHEGWLSDHRTFATKRGLTLTTETDSEFYMRLADQRRPPLGDREEWDAAQCMAAMLKVTAEPTAIAFVDHSSRYPHIWFGLNDSGDNHPFVFYRIKRFKGTFLVSTEQMMTIASHLAFENPDEEVERVEFNVEPFKVYRMGALHDNITVYEP